MSRGRLLLDLLPFLVRRGLAQSPLRRRKNVSGKAAPTDSAPLSGASYWKQSLLGFYQHMFRKRLRALAPDLAVISQGENFDGLHYTEACRNSGIPYVLICQKASTLNWPPDALREEMRRAYKEARHVYFVSEHNRALTERQIAAALTDAEVVRNPYLTETAAALPYPETSSGVFRLACVARLYILEKGQDSLLEVLAQKKWKQRPLEVNFYGQGIHREALERAAEMMELRNVSFCGFVPEITDVWREHHALVLPSRAEGLPLALVEAMMCGRPGIVTNAGGNAEVIEDGKTGFLAAGIDAASLDDVLERAWNRRSEWQQIGLQAAVCIRQLVPADPCGSFTTKLIHLMMQMRDAPSHVNA